MRLWQHQLCGYASVVCEGPCTTKQLEMEHSGSIIPTAQRFPRALDLVERPAPPAGFATSAALLLPLLPLPLATPVPTEPLAPLPPPFAESPTGPCFVRSSAPRARSGSAGRTATATSAASTRTTAAAASAAVVAAALLREE